MTSTQAAPCHPPKPARHPFSLRELFCLLTLACALLAIFLSNALTDEERWLVGPACGGALLGVLLARLCGRRPWLTGLGLGTLGAAVAIAREAIPRYGIYQHLAQRAPGRLPDFWTNLTIMTLSGVLAGFVLALIACACFQLPLWATTRGEKGMLASIRRRPRRAIFVGVAIASLLLVVWQIDAFIWPAAWVPRHTIALPRLPPAELSPGRSGVSMPGSRVALSRRGDSVAVYLSGFIPGRKERFKGTLLYRLAAGRPEPVELPGVSAEQIESPAFSFSNEDGFAFLSYRVDTDQPHDQVNIVDLARTRIVRTMVDAARSQGTLDGDRLDWLPDGTIMHSAWSGGGAILYDAATGEETSRIADDTVYCDARLGHRYQVHRNEEIKVIQLETERGLNSREKNNGGMGVMSIADRIKASRDGRLLLTRSGLHDGKSPVNTVDGEVWTFTNRDQVIVSAGFQEYPWLAHVPFGKRIAAWLNRDALRITEPQTGDELARTRPVPSVIDGVAVSHDGSRIAVLNLEGVHVYDVPAEFR